ncbi:MAG: sugar transferase [Alphaproteobacteria bacterium]|nr:MAG: sugar transferase [Alphaproteobacteria bacterium]
MDELQKFGARKRSARIKAFVCVWIVDFLAIISAMVVAAMIRFSMPDESMLLNLGAFLGIVYWSTALWSGAYHLEAFADRRRFVGRGLRSLIATFLVVSLAFFSFKIGTEYSRLLIFLVFLFAIPGLAFARFFFWPQLNRIFDGQTFAEIIIVDDVEAPFSPASIIISASSAQISPDISSINNVERLSRIGAVIDRIVVYCEPQKRLQWADFLRCLPIRCEVRIPELDQIRPLSVYSEGGRTNAIVSEHPLEWHQAATKRAFDLAVTVCLSPLVFPVMLAVAIAIKIDSPGPIFFRQLRLGQGNGTFMMLKFRSMHVDRQDAAASKLTTRNDSRVTRVGHFIRKTSLDELPQFLNVLAGDMSIVGPRPHAPMALAGDRLYWEVDQKYWHRHIAKPGITGLAQVRGFRGNTFEEDDLRFRLNADLEYVADWSLSRDVEIVFATLRVLKHDKAF